MRLKVVSYTVLVLFLSTAGLALTYWGQYTHQRAVVAELANKVVQTRADLESAMKSLDEIERSVEASDEIITTLNEALSRVTEGDWAITERVAMLERNNVQIRDLLSTRLPDSGCLLDNSCRHTGVPLHPAEPSVAGPVQPTAHSPE